MAQNRFVCVSLLRQNAISFLLFHQVFTSLLSLTPTPPSAHLYLAQLSDDDPRLALKHFGAAVDILVQQLKGKDRETAESARNDEAEIKGNIVRALIGQVEIWMDPSYDLWQVWC
jgi:hypothetical protein